MLDTKEISKDSGWEFSLFGSKEFVPPGILFNLSDDADVMNGQVNISGSGWNTQTIIQEIAKYVPFIGEALARTFFKDLHYEAVLYRKVGKDLTELTHYDLDDPKESITGSTTFNQTIWIDKAALPKGEYALVVKPKEQDGGFAQILQYIAKAFTALGSNNIEVDAKIKTYKYVLAADEDQLPKQYIEKEFDGRERVEKITSYGDGKEQTIVANTKYANLLVLKDGTLVVEYNMKEIAKDNKEHKAIPKEITFEGTIAAHVTNHSEDLPIHVNYTAKIPDNIHNFTDYHVEFTNNPTQEVIDDLNNIKTLSLMDSDHYVEQELANNMRKALLEKESKEHKEDSKTGKFSKLAEDLVKQTEHAKETSIDKAKFDDSVISLLKAVDKSEKAKLLDISKEDSKVKDLILDNKVDTKDVNLDGLLGKEDVAKSLAAALKQADYDSSTNTTAKNHDDDLHDLPIM